MCRKGICVNHDIRPKTLAERLQWMSDNLPGFRAELEGTRVNAAELLRAKVAPRPRGRPSNLSKFLARQGDLFSDAQYRAQLEEKYPHLRSIEGAASNGARPQRSEDAAPGDAVASLGKPIRILLSTTRIDGAGGA